MEEIEALELYELHFSDLILLSSLSASKGDVPSKDQSRLETIRRTIMETLGPNGPGLLSVVGVPNASFLRRQFLPLARDLALLSNDHRKCLLKEHNLGSDVPLKNPDRKVSSFAMQLKYAEAQDSAASTTTHGANQQTISEGTTFDVNEVGKVQGSKFNNLSNAFKELGYCMMELGLHLAQICDEFIGGKELERSLLDSGTAKGRLIHYHSVLDNLLLNEYGRAKKSNKGITNSKEGIEKCSKSSTKNDLWQQWHYDYGIFTVLTAPMFLSSSGSSGNTETPYPQGHSYLKIFDPRTNNVVMVKTSPESFIIQVGESADILSKGKLRSTLHCVSRPLNLDDVSRETFVVFLQPAWSKTFNVPDCVLEHLKLVDLLSSEGNGEVKEHNLNEFTLDIGKIIPPLSSRLRDGMTFAEFSRETTKQYYGGGGLQSNRQLLTICTMLIVIWSFFVYHVI